MASVTGMLNREQLAELVADGRVETVLAVCTDLYGRFVGKRFDAAFYLEQIAAAGTHACDYLFTVDMEMEPVPGYRFANWDSGYGDVHLTASIPADAWREIPLLHQFFVTPLHSLTRFGKWAEVLQEPQPPADSPFWNGLWHYARGLAFTATNRLPEASKELNSLQAIANDKSLEGLRVTFSANGATPILAVATEALAGELAAKQGEFDKAIAHLHRGVLLEDSLVYNEPPDWHIPIRQSLGAVLLEAGRPLEAEMVYWRDLQWNRENGWSLYGLMQSLRAQGKMEEAEAIEKRFQKAWARADVTLSSSRFMEKTERTAAAMSGKRPPVATVRE